MSSWNDHHGDMAECYHGDKIRCYGYIQDGGLCIRANTISSYSESNRQVATMSGGFFWGGGYMYSFVKEVGT